MEKNILFGKTLNLGQLIQSSTRQNSSLTNQSMTSLKSNFDGILTSKMTVNDSMKPFMPKATFKDLKDSVNSTNLAKPLKASTKKEMSIDSKQGKLATLESTKLDQTQSTQVEPGIKEALQAGSAGSEIVEAEGLKMNQMDPAEGIEDPILELNEVKDKLQVLDQLMSLMGNLIQPDSNLKQETSGLLSEKVDERTLISVLEDNGFDIKGIQAVIEKLQNLTTSLTKVENGAMGNSALEALKGLVSKLQNASAQPLKTNELKELLSKFSEVLNEVKTELKTTISQTGANNSQMDSESGQSAEGGEKGLADKTTFKTALNQNTVSTNTSSSSGLKSEVLQSKLTVDGKETKIAGNTVPASSGNGLLKTESNTIAFSKTALQSTENRVEVFRNIMDQVVSGVRTQLKQNATGSMMTLKLNPEHLGNVEVKLELIKGSVLAEFKVESQIVKGALESNLSDLKNALSDKGYQVETMNIQVEKDGRQQHKHQQNDSEQHQQKQKRDEDSQDDNEKNYFKKLIEEMRHGV